MGRAIWSLFWFFFGVGFSLFAGAACDSVVFSDELGGFASDDAGVSEIAENALCIDASFCEEGRLFLFSEREYPCERSAPKEYRAAISEDTSKAVILSGAARVEYCVEIERMAGYLTISHENGRVTRRGSRFTWCVVPATDEPEEMTIRSLTASAEFTLAVP